RQQPGEAERNFRKALQLDSQLTTSRFGLAQIFDQQGKYGSALSELDTALKIDPNNNSLHYLRGRILLRLNRKREAQSELNTATRLLQSQREKRQRDIYGTLPHPELTNSKYTSMVMARTFILQFVAASFCLAVAWGQSAKPVKKHSGHNGDKPQSGKVTQKSTFTSVPIFEDIAASAGLTVPHISSRDKRYVIESMSGG